MMRKHFYSGYTSATCLLFLICCLTAALNPLSAQETFTDYLTRYRAGEGTVTLHQDAEINALVNGLVSYAPGRKNMLPPAPTHRSYSSLLASTDSLVQESLDSTIVFNTGRRVRMNGFRIQVYAGGNNRQSKTEAYRMAGVVRNYFEDISVYTNFISPRWICRVGDFKTREEAASMLSRMRQTGAFHEASIVKTKIIATY